MFQDGHTLSELNGTTAPPPPTNNGQYATQVPTTNSNNSQQQQGNGPTENNPVDLSRGTPTDQRANGLLHSGKVYWGLIILTEMQLQDIFMT